MSRPKRVFKPLPDLKNSQSGCQKKSKINLKLSQNQKLELKKTLSQENNSYSTTWVEPKLVLNVSQTLKIAHLDPKMAKMTLESGQKQNS